jgi:hypothetical protein
MSIGKVTVWHMTEEERLAYIKKHPIIPTEKPKGAGFAEISDAQAKKAKESRWEGKRLMEGVDQDQLHKLFMAGESLENLAKAFNISESTLNNFLKKQRKINPDKWPYRERGRKSE